MQGTDRPETWRLTVVISWLKFQLLFHSETSKNNIKTITTRRVPGDEITAHENLTLC